MSVELIRWRYSTTDGQAGNSVAQPSPNASLGLYVSTTDWMGTASGNLFDPQVASDPVPDYRCVFAVNLNEGWSLIDASAYLAEPLPTMSTLQIGVDPAGVCPLDSSEPQAGVINAETDVPSGVRFSEPLTPQTAIILGALGPKTVLAVWVRRTPAVGAAPVLSESFTLRLSGTLTP